MRKIMLFLFALLVMSNSECEVEDERHVYLVLDKGSNVSSHFNIFHKDNFSVETDYFVTLENQDTKKMFVHKCRDGREFYGYVKGKKYRCRRFYEEGRNY